MLLKTAQAIKDADPTMTIKIVENHMVMPPASLENYMAGKRMMTVALSYSKLADLIYAAALASMNISDAEFQYKIEQQACEETTPPYITTTEFLTDLDWRQDRHSPNIVY